MNDLRNMTEKERIKTYVSKYISYIENLDYEKAYSLLNEDFKQNYFKTIEEFETYAKTLQNRETLFAVVARSKKQNQDKLAIGYIDMYLKKHENADSDLAKQLKTMAKAKTPIFDTAKWDALAKRFNLDFNSGAKTLLRQMVELAKQINNHPFDLQIDKETLLAIQQLTKLSLSPDYPDEGQKIEIER